MARRHGEALGRMDLLTAVMHEMGHLLGLDHADSGLMEDTLEAGMRRLPDDLALMLALGQSQHKKHNAVDLVFADDLLV